MTVKSPRELSVTSYAILGLLASRDWTAYDLTKEMGRNLHYFWPRAESAIYYEARRLTEVGLVGSRQEFQGRRARTIYTITERGRVALHAWLSEPTGRGTLFESESLLRVFLAASGPRDPKPVLSALEAIERDAAELLAKTRLVGGEYLEGRAPFQDQLPWRVHTHGFLVDYALLLAEWAQQTREVVASWEETDEAEVLREAQSRMASARRRLEAAPPLPAVDPKT